MLKRILRVYAYIHPKGYFQGLNDIVSVIIVVLLDIYTYQRLSLDHIRELSDAQLSRVEATAYSFIETIMSLLAVNITSTERDIHAIGLMDDFLYTLRVIHSPALQLDESFLKQQTWRWFVCIFCREFHLEKSIVIWDRLIADPRKSGFRQGIVCIASALIDTIASNIKNPGNIEEVNELNKTYCKDISYIEFSRVLNKAVEIRLEYFHQAPRSVG